MLIPMILLVLASPPETPPVPATVDRVERIAYRCEGGKRITAAWDDPAQKVTITTGGRSTVLDGAVMLSSVDYIAINDVGAAIRLNGGKDQINALSGFPGGPYLNCKKG